MNSTILVYCSVLITTSSVMEYSSCYDYQTVLITPMLITTAVIEHSSCYDYQTLLITPMQRKLNRTWIEDKQEVRGMRGYFPKKKTIIDNFGRKNRTLQLEIPFLQRTYKILWSEIRILEHFAYA